MVANYIKLVLNWKLEVRYEKNIVIYLICRPHNYVAADFLAEFESLFLNQKLVTTVLYVGDFNVWIEDSMNDNFRNFTDIFETLDLKNHIASLT